MHITESESCNSIQPRRLFSLLILGIFVIAGFAVIFSIPNPENLIIKASESEAALRCFIARIGLWGPLLCILAYAVLMLLIVIPSWPCSMIAGLCFGSLVGGACALIGSTLGALGVFVLTRSGLARYVPRNNAVFQKYTKAFRKDALAYLIALRLMPVMPFGMIHVAAGVSEVALSTFVVGTAVGMVPSVMIFAYLGNDLHPLIADPHGLSGAVLRNPKVYIPSAALAALALLPNVIRRRHAGARGQK